MTASARLGNCATRGGTKPPGSYHSCSAIQSSRQIGTRLCGSVYRSLTHCHSGSASYTVESYVRSGFWYLNRTPK